MTGFLTSIRKTKLIIAAAGTGLLLGMSGISGAEAVSEYFGVDLDEATKTRLASKISEIESDPAKRAAFMEGVRHRTVLCKACHGEDGKAIKPLTPNLAGQNLDYLIDQMMRYKSGNRYDAWMTGLAKGFSDDDFIRISIKYAELPEVASEDGDPALVPKGKEIFKNACAECHGEDGRGKQGYARLAGQRADYVVKILKGFKDRTGRRTNPWMTAVSIRLSDEDINAVASYISHIK